MNDLQLRTPIEPLKYPFQIGYTDGLVLIGSCFVEHIGTQLTQLGFNTVMNPSGIVFNPKSIFTTLNHVLTNKQYRESDLIFNRQLWCSLDHHGRFSSTNVLETLNLMQQEIDTAHQKLKTAQFLWLTFGTAYAYKYLEKNQYVANCHKFPSHYFEQNLLSTSEIVSDFESVITSLKRFNPEIKIIFSISPVRHLANGLVGNTRSKSILLTAVHQIIENAADCFYFPSYEILMDDLRDYRFYSSDLCHINEIGVTYIWNYFKDCFFSQETLLLQAQAEQLLKDLNHRSIYENSLDDKRFKQKLEEKKEKLIAEMLSNALKKPIAKH